MRGTRTDGHVWDQPTIQTGQVQGLAPATAGSVRAPACKHKPMRQHAIIQATCGACALTPHTAPRSLQPSMLFGRPCPAPTPAGSPARPSEGTLHACTAAALQPPQMPDMYGASAALPPAQASCRITRRTRITLAKQQVPMAAPQQQQQQQQQGGALGADLVPECESTAPGAPYACIGGWTTIGAPSSRRQVPCQALPGQAAPCSRRLCWSGVHHHQ